MFRFWLHFHPLLILLALLGIFTVAALAIHYMQAYSRLRPVFERRELVAPFFVAVAILFAVFAGFLLANVVAQKNSALKAVQAEGGALMILSVQSETAPVSGKAVREAIRAYARSVIDDEWPEMISERMGTKTEQALFALLRVVESNAVAEEVKPSVHIQMLSQVQQIVTARADRIAIVTNHFQQFAWSGLFLLGFLTQFAIGMVHMGRPQSAALGIATYSFGAVVALWLIAIQDNPFRGPARISSGAVEQVLKVMPAE